MTTPTPEATIESPETTTPTDASTRTTKEERKRFRRGRFTALIAGSLLLAAALFPWVEIQSVRTGVSVDLSFHQGFFAFWAVFGAAGAYTLAISRLWKYAPLFALLFPLPALVYAVLGFVGWGGGPDARLLPGLGAMLGGAGALLSISAGSKALVRLRKPQR